MKHFGKILSLVLALMMLLTVAVSAAPNPDLIYGSMYYSDTKYMIASYSGNGESQWAIVPGAANMGGFGTQNPVGTYIQGSTYSTRPIFTLYGFKRAEGDFNPNKLVVLEASEDAGVASYALPDGYGFEYDANAKVKYYGVEYSYLHAHPSEEYNPVLSFSAPFEGDFRWDLTIARDYWSISGDNYYSTSCGNNHNWNFETARCKNCGVTAHPESGTKTGTYYRVYKNGELVKRYHIEHGSSPEELHVNVHLEKGDVLYFEIDPRHNNIEKDGTRILNCRVFCEELYDGTFDKEYNNKNQKPLYSVALMSDTHTDEDIMLRTDENGNPTPVYRTYLNALEIIKKRGNVDTVLLGGDLVSDNHHHDNKPDYAWSYWSNETIDLTLDFIHSEAVKATQGGKGTVISVAGNHDKDAGYVASFSKNTTDGTWNKWMGWENEVHSGDYFPYFSKLNEKSNQGAKLISSLSFNEMGKWDGLTYNSYYDEEICYAYEINGMYFIGISQPRMTYSKNYNPNNLEDHSSTNEADWYTNHFNSEGLFPQQMLWLDETLETIGKDKTVIVTCHYNTSMISNAAASNTALGQVKDLLLNTLEKYPNVIYTYGHVHGSNQRSVVNYNTSEHVTILGNEVQLKDGSYATDGWTYLYMGGIWNNSFDAIDGLYNQDPEMGQIKIIDFYNDHITISSYNVGTETAVAGSDYLTTYTIKREMTQLDNYSGNGSGNIEFPELPDPTSEGQKYVPTSISNLTNKFTMRLGMDNLYNGNFYAGALYTPANVACYLPKTSSKSASTWYDMVHGFNGNEVIITSQYGDDAIFDFHATDLYAPFLAFKAPTAGAYRYDADLVKMWGSKDEIIVNVVKSDGTLIDQYELGNQSGNVNVNVEGAVYLEEGEEVRIVVQRSDSNTVTSANEVAVLGMTVSQYATYTMPTFKVDGDKVTHTGSSNPKTGAVSIAIVVAVATTAAVGSASIIKRRRSRQ